VYKKQIRNYSTTHYRLGQLRSSSQLLHSCTKREARLPQRNRATRHVSKFVLFHESRFTRYVS